ncbi:MAG: cytochrome P450 [Deltaproteobacteria bacterium]|nr:cytochrome P450 [Deltaproteobacteria bacterium]
MDYNPLLPAVQNNPYPYYAELRDKAPVAWIAPMQAWAVSRYSDVDFALRNPRLFSSGLWNTAASGDLVAVPEAPGLLSMDPPDHTRMRKLANKGFTPRLIREMEPRVKKITQDLLKPMAGVTEADIVPTLTVPLPIIVIAEMLGIELARQADFKRWSDALVQTLNRPTDETVRTEIRRNIAEFRAYLENMIQRRRTEPSNDLITAFVQAEEEHQTLTSIEILGLTVLLLAAGNETTTNLIGNALLALLNHPDELARVRADRASVPALVEEALRYDSPVQVVFRQATQDVELAGGKIPAGATVLLLLGAANRDERKFPEPDRFEVARNPQDHVSFGYGIHYCLGAPLARLQGRTALEALLFDCPPFTTTLAQPPRIAAFLVRGPRTLPLRFAA